MLKLSDRELERLQVRIEDDFDAAKGDHNRRMKRFQRYYQKWRNRVEPPPVGSEDKSNFQVPLVRWHVAAKWAHTLHSLFGDDAEIIAKPVAPTDQRIVHKVGRYMSWRVFDSMEMITPLAIWTFRAILFGRAHAYRPWMLDEYTVSPDGQREVWYEGPGFHPLWPDEIMVPAENKTSIQDFSFVIRKYRASPQHLLDGERQGKYYGIEKNFEKILKHSKQTPENDPMDTEEIQIEKAEAEGVTYDGSQKYGSSLRVFEWFGKWRLPRVTTEHADPADDDVVKRFHDETELRIVYLPDVHLVIASEDMVEEYPHMRNRRPFVECALMQDGSYWSPGFGELLESIEDEVSANHNLLTDAGELTVGPLLFYKPGSGLTPKTFRYTPRMAIPTEDPHGVNMLASRPNLEYAITKEQLIEGYAEKVSGQSDQTLGRAIDRPNAPQTAAGQMALIEQGNIRAYLDVLFFREDMKRMLMDLWMLDCEKSSPDQFFRVTEEEAGGLFDVGNGGATMTSEERGGRYDFDIQFATSYWSREADKQRTLQLYGLSLQNPLIATNPRALWAVTNKVFTKMGDAEFANLIPKPPDLDMVHNPRDEWTMALQGEEIQVSPMDNDDMHLVDHYRRIKEHKRVAVRPDIDAINRMVTHILQHQDQKRAKMMMQALTSQLTDQLAQNSLNPEQGGLNARGPIPMPLQEIQAELAGMTGQPMEQGGGGGGGQNGGGAIRERVRSRVGGENGGD